MSTQSLIALCVGALWIYLLDARRNGRLAAVFLHPKENWRLVVFDLLTFALLGATFVYYVVEPQTPKVAFLAGTTWEATALRMITPSARQKRAARQSTPSASARGEHGIEDPAKFSEVAKPS